MDGWANGRVKLNGTVKRQGKHIDMYSIHIRQWDGSCSVSLKENIQLCYFLPRRVNGSLVKPSSCLQPSDHVHTQLEFSLWSAFAASSVSCLLCSLCWICVIPWGEFSRSNRWSQAPGIITAGNQMLVLLEGKTGFFFLPVGSGWKADTDKPWILNQEHSMKVLSGVSSGNADWFPTSGQPSLGPPLWQKVLY